ncbi:5685_t:CDS:2 [Funneliformis geosporum]|uniref:5685_t:CDS:1 n=1 Tax=Funneliformis geosporum TaxID=1117311 RepID=A0A9W4SAA2_9GLOM|nr:5685_t:CDS:2 [Funneliformis geosporum]
MKLEIWPEAIKAAKNRPLMIFVLGVGIETSKRKKKRVLAEDKTDIWCYFNKLDLPKPKHKKGSCNSHLEAHHSILRFEKESNNNPIQTKIDAMFQKQ